MKKKKEIALFKRNLSKFIHKKFRGVIQLVEFPNEALENFEEARKIRFSDLEGKIITITKKGEIVSSYKL